MDGEVGTPPFIGAVQAQCRRRRRRHGCRRSAGVIGAVQAQLMMTVVGAVQAS